MKYDYDLISIGLGPAGMAVSIMGSAMGLKVCAVEKHKVGGECMNCGCIPSKALLRMALFRHHVSKLPVMRLAALPLPNPGEVFDKIQEDLQFINEKKTMKMFDKVDLMLRQGPAEFVDPHTVQVGDRRITARRIFIAAGTRPMIFPVPGIENVDVLTNETIFKLDAIPESLTILGGGAIACEMAQAFARLGSRVNMVQRSCQVLSNCDADAVAAVQQAMRDDGVNLITGDTARSIHKEEGNIVVETDGGQRVTAKKLLAAWGRSMDFSALKLDNAGVQWDKSGIKVNRWLQTTRNHIYAVGDCNGRHLLSHAAMHQGMIALMNNMLPWPARLDFRKFVVPATVFTEPQLSYAGMSECELKEKGIRYEAHVATYEDYGAAIAEEVKAGFVKVFSSPAGRLYGAVIVGEGSGEMINEWALAIQKKIRMHDIMMLQHSFPTMGFLSKRVAETWMMSKMKSQRLQALCRFMFRF